MFELHWNEITLPDNSTIKVSNIITPNQVGEIYLQYSRPPYPPGYVLPKECLLNLLKVTGYRLPTYMEAESINIQLSSPVSLLTADIRYELVYFTPGIYAKEPDMLITVTRKWVSNLRLVK